MDPRGNATAIWTGFGDTVRVASEPAGGAWEQPATIGSGVFAQLALDTNGDVTAVWENSNRALARTVAQSAFRPAGGSWGQPVTFAQVAGFAPGLRVAVDPGGDALASWETTKLGGCDCASTLMTAFRPAGGVWRHPIIVARRHYGFVGDVQIALGRRAHATAVWSDNGQVKAASGSAGGPWSAAVTIATPHATARGLQLGHNAPGDALAIWLRPQPAQGFYAGYVQGATRLANGKWRRAISLTGGLSSWDTSSPAVGVDAHGNAVVAWSHIIGNGRIVEAATLTRPGHATRAAVPRQ